MTKTKIPLHYWDACTFIHLIAGNEPDGGTVLKTLARHVDEGKLLIATSTYTLAEVVRPRKRPKQLSPADRAKIEDVFRLEKVRVYELTRAIAERARELQWEATLRPADAVHLATAEYARVVRFHTYDDGLIGNAKTVRPDFWKYTFDIERPNVPQEEFDLRTGPTR